MKSAISLLRERPHFVRAAAGERHSLREKNFLRKRGFRKKWIGLYSRLRARTLRGNEGFLQVFSTASITYNGRAWRARPLYVMVCGIRGKTASCYPSFSGFRSLPAWRGPRGPVPASVPILSLIQPPVSAPVPALALASVPALAPAQASIQAPVPASAPAEAAEAAG